MRRLLLVLCFSLFATQAFAQAQNVNDRVLEIWRQGATAYSNGDMHGFLDAMLELEEFRPHQLPMLYNVAAGYALTGQVDLAMAKLNEIAESGAYIDVEADSDFDAIRGHADYPALLRAMDALMVPRGETTVVREINMRGVLPEGVEVDAASGTIFVSTVQSGEIWRVSPDGNVTQFLANDADPRLGGLFGMAADAGQNLLWVTSATLPQYSGVNLSANPPSALFGINLTTAEIEYYFPLEGEDHVLGEVVIAPNGDIYVSDSATPALYRISDDYTRLTRVYANDQMRSFQGFDFDPQGRIYVADYVHGIFRIDPEAHEFERVELSEPANLSGVDGLFYASGSLITIRNGLPPNRITRYELSEDGLTIIGSEVLANNLDLWDEPTLGQVVGRRLYYNAASGWPNFTADGEIEEGAVLQPIRIMSVDLN